MKLLVFIYLHTDYDQKSSAIDIWAMGVTVLELFRGGLVFKGSSNTEVLWEVMNLLGPIPKKTLKDCRYNFFRHLICEVFN